ncbi:MAG: Gfo/Idh/MocA family oxidoreductase [Fibrobacteres bacterium]|jgi:predicted dehydrogenase|nr:Gfo/Idh/MocA family oxidoreductase [Fibrobacterota bacterium]
MTHSPFRVGVVGAGGIARGQHLPGWRGIPNVNIVAIADINKAAASAAAMEFGAAHVFTDFQDLLKLDLDAVDVCTPNLSHVPIVQAALEAGKHVICEKPLAVTAREVRQIGELADAKGLKLMTAQHHRFGAAGRAAKRWAEQGFLGPVYHARVRAMRRAWLPVSPGFIDARLSGGGPCMDIGVHALDLCLWLMGFPEPARVSGTARVNFAKGSEIPGMWGEWNRELYSVEDFAAGFVHFKGPSGGTLGLETAWLGHQAENEEMGCQLFGLKGGLKWPDGHFASVQGGVFAQGSLTYPTHVENAYLEELRAFHDCIVNGTPSPVPWRETEKVIAILEAIYTSQKEGREVVLGIS